MGDEGSHEGDHFGLPSGGAIDEDFVGTVMEDLDDVSEGALIGVGDDRKADEINVIKFVFGGCGEVLSGDGAGCASEGGCGVTVGDAIESNDPAFICGFCALNTQCLRCFIADSQGDFGGRGEGLAGGIGEENFEVAEHTVGPSDGSDSHEGFGLGGGRRIEGGEGALGLGQRGGPFVGLMFRGAFCHARLSLASLR